MQDRPDAMHRRRWLATTLSLLAGPGAAQTPAADEVRALLQRGGVVIAMRHALAPGTFDPEGFRLDDCSTQRNLNDEGREQARRLGRWFRSQGLTPARVRTSPWCRCIESAELAFGKAERWAALGSPARSDVGRRERQLAELQGALAAVPAKHFEAWVTHGFVLQALVSTPAAPAEALVLRAGGSTVHLLARAALH